MTNSYYKISLDIHDHGSNVSLKAKKGDTGRLLYITLMDGRNPYVITDDCYAVFAAKKADGNILYNKCSITGNTISYAFTPQTTSAVGKAECEIKLYGADDKLITSARFTLVVEDTVYNEGDEIEPEKEVSALTALISDATTLINDVTDKLNSGAFIGPQGISGVIAPTKGFFALEMDSATGDIYCVTEENASAPTFTLEDGNLYYEIEEV
ncbi:MAG: BppU family phage baseplate upper protein [Bacteroidales bacterium]|nr:BppU family phage baseplate upper protein [Bacteroidales bacterium]